MGSITKSLGLFLGHLTPIRCPIVLAPLLVLIEICSILARPISLSVRIIANLTCGHLLLYLCGCLFLLINTISRFRFILYLSNYIKFMVRVLIMLIFVVLEFAVALIQRYVFNLLIGLYSLE